MFFFYFDISELFDELVLIVFGGFGGLGNFFFFLLRLVFCGIFLFIYIFEFEFKLFVDVGFVGFLNVGKLIIFCVFIGCCVEVVGY